MCDVCMHNYTHSQINAFMRVIRVEQRASILRVCGGYDMVRMSLDQFLNGRTWRIRADERKHAAGFRCEQCGARTVLDVHHLTYENVGRERDEDLIVLCRRCHAAAHSRPLPPEQLQLPLDALIDDFDFDLSTEFLMDVEPMQRNGSRQWARRDARRRRESRRGVTRRPPMVQRRA
jgi:hypothetical protein